jgi:hypothetical protein
VVKAIFTAESAEDAEIFFSKGQDGLTKNFTIMKIIQAFDFEYYLLCALCALCGE